jgi:hypothetical protein
LGDRNIYIFAQTHIWLRIIHTCIHFGLCLAWAEKIGKKPQAEVLKVTIIKIYVE